MANNSTLKMKMLALWEILREGSDEERPLSTNEICRLLCERGIRCERKSVATDVALLQKFGYGVEKAKRGRDRVYWVPARPSSAPAPREQPCAEKKLLFQDKEDRMHELTIRRETEADFRAVEELTREAFWNVYKPGADEHYYVHEMRKHPDFLPELAFVLTLDGRIVGNIMFTKAWLEDEEGNRKEIVSAGPLCIAPEFQRQRFGKLLIEHSFDAARRLGYDVNVNFGNPGNYVSRGFVSCKKKNVCCFAPDNFPTALLVCELVPGALDGRKWTYIASTAADCCEDAAAVEAFDAGFPPREKKWMPSQEEFYIYRNSSVVR